MLQFVADADMREDQVADNGNLSQPIVAQSWSDSQVREIGDPLFHLFTFWTLTSSSDHIILRP